MVNEYNITLSKNTLEIFGGHLFSESQLMRTYYWILFDTYEYRFIILLLYYTTCYTTTTMKFHIFKFRLLGRYYEYELFGQGTLVTMTISE